MKTILVVDDKASIRELISETIPAEDYHVLEAASGEEALNILRNGMQPDLILLDIMMPGGIDGLETCRRIRKLPEPRPFVVLLSALGQQTDIRKGMEAGADEYFTKPFSPMELLAFLERMLGETEE